LLGVQEVPSSNLGGPTSLFKHLQLKHSAPGAFWRPLGVQMAPEMDAKCGDSPLGIFPLALSTSRKNPTNPTFGA
jgi:hypothetical protein